MENPSLDRYRVSVYGSAVSKMRPCGRHDSFRAISVRNAERDRSVK